MMIQKLNTQQLLAQEGIFSLKMAQGNLTIKALKWINLQKRSRKKVY
jgi:hypothetical protein